MMPTAPTTVGQWKDDPEQRLIMEFDGPRATGANLLTSISLTTYGVWVVNMALFTLQTSAVAGSRVPIMMIARGSDNTTIQANGDTLVQTASTTKIHCWLEGRAAAYDLTAANTMVHPLGQMFVYYRDTIRLGVLAAGDAGDVLTTARVRLRRVA